MIISTTAEGPYILMDVMQLCQCVNAIYIHTHSILP